VLDRPTDFEVSGTDLNDGMSFQLTGCAGVAEAAGGSRTRRVFSCTPSGTAGSHALQLYSSTSATTSLATRTVDYLTPVVKAGEVNRNLAVLKADGSLWVWTNDWAASTDSHVVITRTQLGSNFVDLEVGQFYGLAISADAGLWAWGVNNYAVFANGPREGSATPVRIGEGFSKVAVKGANTNGGERVAGLKRDGTLWAWGARSSPIPNAIDMQYTPHQFGSSFSDLAIGSAGASMALKADGSLWSWNENISDTPFVPKKIGDGYRIVATAYAATFGIKNNGELWAWGRNAPNRAQAGGDDVAVLLGKDFASVSASAVYVMALKTDGTLWAPPGYPEGQPANGTTVGGLVQVASGVRNVWAGNSCSVIEKRDGTLWGTSYCAMGVISGLPPGFHQLPQF
jgi:alpha-tubulin suppressor-like RCC1 family protein